MSKKLLALFEKQTEISKKIHEEVKRLYPVGVTIRFQKSCVSFVTAQVIRHNYDTGLFVRNVDTDKEYWMSVSTYNLPKLVED